MYSHVCARNILNCISPQGGALNADCNIFQLLSDTAQRGHKPYFEHVGGDFRPPYFAKRPSDTKVSMVAVTDARCTGKGHRVSRRAGEIGTAHPTRLAADWVPQPKLLSNMFTSFTSFFEGGDTRNEQQANTQTNGDGPDALASFSSK